MTNKTASPLLVYLAFAIVYVVWGSTYFFYPESACRLPSVYPWHISLYRCRHPVNELVQV